MNSLYRVDSVTIVPQLPYKGNRCDILHYKLVGGEGFEPPTKAL